MKGDNELRLNEATLIEALQEYLEKRMGEHAPHVRSVASVNHGEFRVAISDAAPR